MIDEVERVARAIDDALEENGVVTIAFMAEHPGDTKLVRAAREVDRRRAFAAARAAIGK